MIEAGFSLKGKTAIVTGSAGIIGSRVCRGLLEAGASVAMFDLKKDNNQKIIDAFDTQWHPRVLNLACDVTDKKSVESAVAEVVSKWKKIDILHNNAAGKSDDLEAFFAPFEDYTMDQWNKIMKVNVDGMVLMAQAVGRQMVAQKSGGSIIQTASIYGIMAPDQRIYEGSQYLGRTINTPAVYAASKGAVVALTLYLSTYWAKQGIRVNSITPGGVESGQNETFKNNYSSRVPMGRMARADEMVGAVIFLASQASSYITGQNIIVDGGLSAW